MSSTGQSTAVESTADGDGPTDSSPSAPARADKPGSGDSRAPGDIWLGRFGYGATLLPFAVAAVALLVSGHGSYIPAADHAMIEARTMDVTHRPPLIGLYSRGDWAHPGPLMFYVLAPFHWLTAGSPVATHLGALAVNGGSVLGMVFLARRRGGLPLMLITAVANGLLMRTLGAEFLHDPWNTYLPVLPFGLLIFLSWSLACGDRWALPVAVLVTSFVAQTHVGFMALAFPLLAWGALWLVVSTLRTSRPGQRDEPDPPDDDADAGADAGTTPAAEQQADASWWGRLQPLLRPTLAASAVGLLVWLLPLVDIVRNSPSNAQRILRWFTADEADTLTLGGGLRVITGQFSLPPEWLTTKQAMTYSGESPFLSGPFPVSLLLVPVVAAALFLLHRGTARDRHLVGVLGVTLAIGTFAMWRTVRPAFDYRLRWTWVPPMVAFVVVAWACWLLVRDRWPARASRGLAPVAAVLLVTVTSVNVVTAARGGEPYRGDTEVLTTIGPQVLEALPEGEGVVYVTEPFFHAAWYSRGLALYLEHQGVDVRVEEALRLHFGGHRVYDGEPLRAKLVVMVDEGIDIVSDEPGLSLVGWWASEHADLWEDEREVRDGLNRALEAGEIEEDGYLARVRQLTAPDIDAVHYRVAVFLDERPG